MEGIYWLSSYPKSGNTWLRIFLVNYLRNLPESVDINDLKEAQTGAARQLFDDQLGIDTSMLTGDELNALRPAVYCALVENTQSERRFFKVHDALCRLASGAWLFPEEATLGVIYVIRNPLDVAVSYANHTQSTVNQAIAWMAQADHELFIPSDTYTSQIRQKLTTWSNHVSSWVDQSLFRLHVVRYEDMTFHPIETFTRIVHFIGDQEDAARIERAVHFSEFDTVKQQEAEHGFREKAQTVDTFFRKGKVGSWRDELNEAQVERIIGDHGEVMRRFGYLSETDEPIY